jgi:lipoprotein-releasing system permease protein
MTLRRLLPSIEIGLGIVLGIVGVTLASGSDDIALPVGLIIIGFVLELIGMIAGGGYRSFVAFRYLLVNPPRVAQWAKVAALVLVAVNVVYYFAVLEPFGDSALRVWLLIGGGLLGLGLFGVLVVGFVRHSFPALVVVIACVVLYALSLGVSAIVARDMLPFVTLEPEQKRIVMQIVGFVGLGLLAKALFWTIVGCLRAFFTFFTTVPVVGVFMGTQALVIVLAVMSGFETDLREKILGSNAHIQVTREDGEFTNWRDVKKRIDQIPGVVASTPFAVSEVVIAANNNGMPVIIKGIDPATVGAVTDLVSDLDDREAMRRLHPLVDDAHDRVVTQPKPQPGKKVLDPPPDDMPNGGEPIDFSSHDPDDDVPPPPPEPAPKHDAGDPDTAPVSPYGGDAVRILEEGKKPPVIDPPPSDMLTTDETPKDYSGSDGSGSGSGSAGDTDDPEITVHATDIPLEPTLSRRTQALPGILVGRELVKQTHLYTGEEVRVVSPLSDPSNPDATGTPIPFNRDYRVAGVFYTGMYEYDLKYVYVTLDSLQDFLDRGDAVDGIEVRIHDPDDTGRYVPSDLGPGLIAKALGAGYRVQDWRELNRSLFSALKLEKIAMFLVLGIVILVASFSIVGNLIMVVVEKGKEIALLKTLGAGDIGVMQLFAIQGLLIGLIGTALGVSFGLIQCWLGKRYGLPLDPDVYYIDRLPIHIDPGAVVAAAAAGVLISIAATLYPALLAARIRPAQGLRH